MSDDRAAKRQRRAEEVRVGPQAWGIPGIQGVPGDDGPAGPQGAAGATGAAGAAGADGADGLDGLDGLDGAEGLQGPAGAAGSQGIQGIQGIPGDAGDPGTDGDEGPQGVQGIQGVQGVPGDPGAPGVDGDEGSQGVQGIQGIPGLSVWGEITGTLALQTDLDTALSGKSATGHAHPQSEVAGLVTDLAAKEPANANLQAHVASAHAPAGAQVNADITKAEIEAKLTGAISSHTHAGGGGDPAFAPGSFTVATGTFRYFAQRVILTGSQRATVEGTAMVRIG